MEVLAKRSKDRGPVGVKQRESGCKSVAQVARQKGQVTRQASHRRSREEGTKDGSDFTGFTAIPEGSDVMRATGLTGFDGTLFDIG